MSRDMDTHSKDFGCSFVDRTFSGWGVFDGGEPTSCLLMPVRLPLGKEGFDSDTFHVLL